MQTRKAFRKRNGMHCGNVEKKNDLKNAIKEMCSLKVILVVVVVIFEFKRY